PLEIVAVAPIELGLTLRPYQWGGGLLGLALALLVITKKLSWPLFRWHPIDTILTLLVGGIVLSGVIHQGLALKQSIILVSFLGLYFLSRLFLRTGQDIGQALRFFFLSGSLVLGWALVQNILFLTGHESFSVMPGRPNGTLSEPDWLGLFILFLLAPTLFWLKTRLVEGFDIKKIWLPWGMMTLLLLVLILTVSRSAWLGGVVLTSLFILTAFFEFGKPFMVRGALLLIQCLSVSLVLALVCIETVPLTRFALIDRAASTASHDQTITLACDGSVLPPAHIGAIEELAQYGCQHILLEETELYREQGKLVTTTKRPDPNVGIRKKIYELSLTEIQAHPLLGIGWGNIGPKLGVDERGASYNASNLFLELWLGGGLMALGAFLAFLGWVFWVSYRAWKTAFLPEFFAPIGALTGGFLVFNLFNTGLLLGFVWVWFALFPVVFPRMNR
ncbi:MAG: O-antigen ligase family protein, partial [Candidatus Moraniibacteriota bacterium]